MAPVAEHLDKGTRRMDRELCEGPRKGYARVGCLQGYLKAYLKHKIKMN